MALPSPLFTILGRGARPKIAPSNDAYRELQFSLEPNRLYIALFCFFSRTTDKATRAHVKKLLRSQQKQKLT